jgi:hypothetical protein
MATTDKNVSGWSGWVFFAGVMMMLAGIFNAIAGLTALLRHSWYLVSSSNLLVFNYTAWGWIDLSIGLLLLLAGSAVLHGAVWARVVGVVIASLSAVGALASVNAYPVWSIIVLVVDVLVIHALIVHGDEFKDQA